MLLFHLYKLIKEKKINGSYESSNDGGSTQIERKEQLHGALS